MENTQVGKLKRGQWLVLTDEGQQAGLQGRALSPTGQFRGIAPGGAIRGQRDGLKGYDLWSPLMWNVMNA